MCQRQHNKHRGGRLSDVYVSRKTKTKKINILEPRHYIPNFLKIRAKDARIIPLAPKPAQEKLLRTVEKLKSQGKPIRIIILKARQLGFSTYIQGLFFNDEVSNELKNGMIVAHEDEASKNLYQMYRTFYEYLPPELTPMTKYSNAQEMLFENPTNDVDIKRKNPGLRSKVSVQSARNVDAGRSQTIHNLHCSEVAFWRDPKTLMTGLLQTVPGTPNTMVFIESTANGVGGWFYDFWNAAVRGENDFIPLFFPWFEEPEYTTPFPSKKDKKEFIKEVNETTIVDGMVVHTEEYDLMKEYNLTYEQLYWRRKTISTQCSGDVEMFRQEYPSTADEAFVASGRPRFNVTSLRAYRKQQEDGERGYLEYKQGSVVFVPDPKGYVEIWRKPRRSIDEEPEFFAIGADVAEGLKDGDYSCAYVGDNDFNVVAKWYGHIDPDLFGKELVKLGKYYNDAYIGVESNNHGLTTLRAIQAEDYFNIYFMKTHDKVTDVITQKIGWQTTNRTKPLMIDKLAEFIRERWLGVKCRTFISEAFTYVREDNGSTNAQSGCHDDTVMAMAILLQLLLEGKGDFFVPYVPQSKANNVMQQPFPYRLRQDDDDLDEEDELEISR